MELEHNFYGVNFAPFPRRGNLSSENAHRRQLGHPVALWNTV